ncbi:MAG: MFS transporter, partial [Nocardioidaceae bacterium]
MAIPWFVLTTTGSATQTGLVAFAEMAPYVTSKALGGPVIDRVGARRISVSADVVSAALVGMIPLLHALGALHFGALLVLVAVAGAVRGPGDASKGAIVPYVADAARVPLERVTGLDGTVERLASTLGPAAAGIIIAVVGAAPSLVIDASSFALCAALIGATSPRAKAEQDHDAEDADGGDGYFAQLRAGGAFLRDDHLLRSIIAMVGTTNLLDAAMASVLLPVWAHESGGGPAAIGLVFATFGAAAIGGSLVASTRAERLPRRMTYLLRYVVAGRPRFLVLALGAPLWLVVVVHVVSGSGAGFLNPIIGAVIYERIPRRLLGRVGSLIDALAWAGIPLGGIVGG